MVHGANYLRLVRARLLLACFAGVSVLLVAFPWVDLRVSREFYDGGFPLAERWWSRALHAGLPYAIGAALAFVAAIWIYNRLAGRRLLGVGGRSVLYLLLVLMLGAVLVVNYGLKDHFGRARPRDVQEFGGTRQFTPAFVVSDQCRRNCSFSSGEGAGGFFFLAVARALSRRRAVFLAALAFGLVVASARVVSGAHFLSDTIVSFFIMLLATDVLHHYLLSPPATRAAT